MKDNSTKKPAIFTDKIKPDQVKCSFDMIKLTL